MMRRAIFFVIALGLTAPGCVFRENSARATESRDEKSAQPSDIERARAILEARHSGEVGSEARFGTTTLAGYNFHEEVHPPGGTIFMFVSLHGAGSVWLFDSDGELTQQLPTGEILAVRSRDVDGDGTLEFLTEEVDGFGTGVRMEGFHLYGLVGDTLVSVWSGQSKTAISPPPTAKDTAESRTGFVRFGGRGQAGESTMVHVVWDHARSLVTEKVFELSRSDGSLNVIEVGETTRSCPQGG